ncbi:MAG TPA: HAD-IA family hydrolase [Syntrophales bacterium]|nr:HAD-IA family hydrolase [Syntrophales bacterium]
MANLELMIFDFDGTLVSSGEDIAASVNHVLAAFGLPVREGKEIMQFIGDGVMRLIERSLGPAHVNLKDEALALFSTHYGEHMLDSTRLYGGIDRVLDHFREKDKIIVTNKRHYFTVKMADALGIKDSFSEIIGRDSGPYSKPDGRLVLSVLSNRGIDPRRAVVIGDGANDILMAKDAGVWSCAYLNGLSPAEDLLRLKPDFAYHYPVELIKIFS